MIDKAIENIVEKKIKATCIDRGISLREMARKIGMSNTGFHQAMKANSLKASVLYVIAQTLDVPVQYFFEEQLSIKKRNEFTLSHTKKASDKNKDEYGDLKTQIHDLQNDNIWLEKKMLDYANKANELELKLKEKEEIILQLKSKSSTIKNEGAPAAIYTLQKKKKINKPVSTKNKK